MEMTTRQRELYELGCEYNKKGFGINAIVDDMLCNDPALFDDVFNSRWLCFFYAGVDGVEPEYVKAVRYGDVPESGYSINHATGESECGVSVIRILRRDGDFDKPSIYDILLGMQRMEKIVVEGWYLGDSGADGEPIIRECRKAA